MAFPTAPANGQFYTTLDGRRYRYSLVRDSWEFDKSTTTGIKDNLNATAPPSATDDTGSGYSVGSVWIDVINKKSYINVHANAGVAVWEAPGGGTTVVSTTVPTAPVAGQLFYNSTTDKVFIWDGFAWIDIVAGGSSSAKQNVTNVDPSTSDDSTSGYSPGSIWINTITSGVFINISSTAAAAIWYGVASTSNTSPIWIIKSAAYVAVKSDHIFVDTQLAPVSITLPIAPSLGDSVAIVDMSGTFSTNPCTIIRNGNPLMGLLTDMILNIDFTKLTVTFTGSDWRITT